MTTPQFVEGEIPKHDYIITVSVGTTDASEEFAAPDHSAHPGMVALVLAGEAAYLPQLGTHLAYLVSLEASAGIIAYLQHEWREMGEDAWDALVASIAAQGREIREHRRQHGPRPTRD
jgi:hypothetical protein